MLTKRQQEALILVRGGTMDTEYRSLPTPEQIRAHGDGGLWNTSLGQYKLWSDRTLPWFDGPTEAGYPPARKWRPLNPDGQLRDWAEIDAIVAAAAQPVAPVAAAADTSETEWRPLPDTATLIRHPYWVEQEEPSFKLQINAEGQYRISWNFDFDVKLWHSIAEDRTVPGRTLANPARRWRPCDSAGTPIAWSAIAQPQLQITPEPPFRHLSREIVEANPGQLWEWCADSMPGRIWRLAHQNGDDVADFTANGVSWSAHSRYVNFPWSKQEWRPLHPDSTPLNRRPIAWSELKQPVAAQPRIWSPQGDCKITKLEYSDGTELSQASRGIAIGRYTASVSAFEGDLSRLPPVFDLVVEAQHEQIDILVGCRRSGNMISYIDYIIRNGKTLCSVPRMPIETPTFQRVSGSVLDCFAAWYNTTRKPNETDEQLRQRCRDLWTAQEKPMATQPTQVSFTVSTTPALPDFAKMSPEDRARYRAALDAVDPPTTRDAIRSGLEHAPVEIALDKLHNFVAKLANLWTEGSDEDRQTAARFLRDMVGSDYGKAAIGLAAGAALPHAAPLANKLLPDDKGCCAAAASHRLHSRRTWRRNGAKQLGLDIMDATGPIVTELRSLLAELLSGMRKAETVAGLLPPASSRLSFDGALTVESAETKR